MQNQEISLSGLYRACLRASALDALLEDICEPGTWASSRSGGFQKSILGSGLGWLLKLTSCEVGHLLNNQVWVLRYVILLFLSFFLLALHPSPIEREQISNIFPSPFHVVCPLLLEVFYLLNFI